MLRLKIMWDNDSIKPIHVCVLKHAQKKAFSENESIVFVSFDYFLLLFLEILYCVYNT